MVLRDVRNLMAEYGCKFRFALRGQYQAAIHPDKAAGHRKGVDGVIIEDKKFERLAWLTAVKNQRAAELIQVVCNFGIIQIAFIRTYLIHALFADLPFMLRGQCFLRNVAQIRQAFGMAEQ